MIIAVFTPLWKRPEIAAIFKAGIEKNRQYLAKKGIKLKLFTVLSPEDPHYSELKELFPNSIECSNEYLGRKKNYGLQQIRGEKWDYLLEMGSDDLLSNHYFERIPIGNCDFFGMYQVFMLDYYTSKLYLMKGYKWKDVLGGGRFLHRDYCEGDLWDDKRRVGMDGHMEQVLWNRYKIKPIMIETNDRPYLLDIKTYTNLHTIHEQKNLGVLEEKEPKILDSLFDKSLLKKALKVKL